MVQIVIALAVALAGFGFVLLTATLFRRRGLGTAGPSGARIVRSEEEAEPGPPPPTVATPVPDSPEVQVNRRAFLNRAWLLALSVFGVAFGATSLGFLWSNKSTGFGSIITITRDEVEEAIRLDGRYYNPTGRFYMVTYPHTDDPENQYVQEGVAAGGLMTLYQKCAHLGCRVPFCPTSEWFECPCHGSRYNYAGEVMPGSPAPAGLWRFPMTITDSGDIEVNTAMDTAQPPKGVDTISRPPAGPHCIAGAEGAEE